MTNRRGEPGEHVPFVDLVAQYRDLKPQLDAAIQAVIDVAGFVGGPAVTEFARDFAAYCGVGHGVGAASGTAALHLALLALDVGPGDEVITVPNTFIATAEAIAQTGAKPVFVDVDPETLTLDPTGLEAALTGKTKAIIPVHLYGQMADMDAIARVAAPKGIPLVEDAAQAHGAEYKKKRAGRCGRAAAFSFYPGKILGAFGDAGMVVTSDPGLAARVSRLANHGRTGKYDHIEKGYNYRLDALQAAVLSVKLAHLDTWISKRTEKARLYGSLLQGSDVRTPAVAADRRHVFTYYVVRTPTRDVLRQALDRAGIDTVIHYPLPLHLQPAFSDLGYRPGDFPVAESAAAEILSLPIYPELPDETIHRIASIVRRTAG